MIHKIIVIEKKDQSAANAFLNSLGTESEPFIQALFKNKIHTHYWSGWLMTDQQYEEVRNNPMFKLYETINEVFNLELFPDDSDE